MITIQRFKITCILLIPFCSMAQTTVSRNAGVTLPTVALLDIEPTGVLNLNFVAPTEAGRPLVAPPANTTKWLNYTSALALGGNNRSITVSLNELIPGVDIKLKAASAVGGGGTLGTVNSEVVLSMTPKVIVNGIGGAYTGNGANQGHQLTITLVPTNYALLSAIANKSIVIHYTISE